LLHFVAPTFKSGEIITRLSGVSTPNGFLFLAKAKEHSLISTYDLSRGLMRKIKRKNRFNASLPARQGL